MALRRGLCRADHGDRAQPHPAASPFRQRRRGRLGGQPGLAVGVRGGGRTPLHVTPGRARLSVTARLRLPTRRSGRGCSVRQPRQSPEPGGAPARRGEVPGR
ncbi:hypothetical protein G6F58_013017 [Rhizopus delemar]|nr:hypothetical protein G6F58_013017 [Rhizopus delemar]